MSIKKLAGQTLWYGLSNIVGRFLNFFLTSILLAWLYKPEGIAAVSQVYVIVPFLNIIFTLGLETTYFRFSQLIDKQKLFNTLNTFLIGTSILFTILLMAGKQPMTQLFDMQRSTDYYIWMIWIVCIDSLSTIPFAKLRHEGRPKKFAVIKFMNIMINVAFVVFWLIVCPYLIKHGTSIPTWLYNPTIGVGYLIIAGLISSIGTLMLLLPEWKGYQPRINIKLLKEIMLYSFPIIIVGFGGMINDFLSRIMYYRLLSDPVEVLDHEFGVFIANYKLAVLATLFIQVFKMGAEPFFFNQANSKDAPETYARITKFFVIICCFIFLGITMNLHFIESFIAHRNKEYAEGMHIIPVLTMANIFIGIYYNLSIWYKLTNRTMSGAVITLIGVGITVILNILLVPLFHYTGASWATFACYLSMLVITYVWGKKHYPVPYDVKKLVLYLGLVYAMFLGKQYLFDVLHLSGFIAGITSFVISSLVFMAVVITFDKEEMKALPVIGKMIA